MDITSETVSIEKDSDFNTFSYEEDICQQQKESLEKEGIFDLSMQMSVAMERHYDAFIIFRWYIQSYTNFLNASVSSALFDYIFDKVDFNKCMKMVIYKFVQLVPHYCFPKQSSINPLHQKWLMEIAERIGENRMLSETSFCRNFSNILIRLIEKDEQTISNLTMKYLSLFHMEDNCLFYTNYEIIEHIFYQLKEKYKDNNAQCFIDDYIVSFIEMNVRSLYKKVPVDFKFNARIVNKFIEFLNDEEIKKINSIITFFKLKEH